MPIALRGIQQCLKILKINNMRWTVATLILFYFVMPSTVMAVDQRCFTKTNCQTMRASLGLSPAEAESGFVSASKDASIQNACGGATDAAKNEVGFCLPISQSKTTISFGGKTEFSDIGDFIRYIYRYGIWAAGIIAVVMIIIAGIQWSASGGSADMIGAAQKRIGGALAGLVLLALSYVILNTVNPYLVNLRLPQVWLINTQTIISEFCYKQPSDKFSYVGNQSVNPESNKTNATAYDITLTSDKTVLETKFACGDQLLSKSSGGKVCRGHHCTPGSNYTRVCLKDAFSKKYECKDGQIAGKIINSNWEIPVWKNWESGADVVDDFEMYFVCKDGKIYQIDEEKEDIKVEKNNEIGQYAVKVSNKEIFESGAQCGKEGVIGLVMFPDFDENLDPFDEAHYIGVNPSAPTRAIDLGDKNTDFFKLIANNELYKNRPAEQFLIPISVLDYGYILNIDVGDITDID